MKLPTTKIKLGLEALLEDKKHQSKINGRVGYLCHSASLNQDLELGPELLKKLLGPPINLFTGPSTWFYH